MPLVMPDSREPVPTTLGFAISRWGRPGELASVTSHRTFSNRLNIGSSVKFLKVKKE